MTLDAPNGALALQRQRHYRRCRVFRISLRRGDIKRFTTWDKIVHFEDQEFRPAYGVEGSARRMDSGIKPKNQEFTGILSSEEIADADLASGAYDRAKVDEWEIDPLYPFAGHFNSSVYFIDRVEFQDNFWKADVVGLNELLGNNMGEQIQKTCRWDFGEPHCNRTIEPSNFFAANAPGSPTPTPSWTNAEHPRINTRVVSNVVDDITFDAASGSGIPAAYVDRTLSDGTTHQFFRHGRVIWTQGNNAGMVSRIVNYDHPNRRITLAIPAGYPVDVGDQFDIIAGCDGKITTCVEVWDNLDQHRAWPWIPTGGTALDIQ